MIHAWKPSGGRDPSPSASSGSGVPHHWTSSRTPMQTRAAEIQRRRSTFSCRKNLARMAEQMKVSEAEAGATRLASPQESAVSRQKKLKMRQARAQRKSFSRTTRLMTASSPRRARRSSRSPMRFMAAESRTSPELEARTRVAMAIQSLSEFMLLLGAELAVGRELLVIGALGGSLVVGG